MEADESVIFNLEFTSHLRGMGITIRGKGTVQTGSCKASGTIDGDIVWRDFVVKACGGTLGLGTGKFKSVTFKQFRIRFVLGQEKTKTKLIQH